MNARSQIFELSVEGRQIEEVVQSVFHSLLLHRTLGKFHYKQEGSYSIGTVGFMDVDCDYIDFTYVRVASDELDQNLRREVSMFRDTLRSHDGPRSGQISLEFYQKKRARWPFQSECIPWEVWTVKLDIITLANEHERQVCREKLGEMLAEKVMYVAETMNRHEYVPKMPNQSDLDLIFDTMYPDVQPYLYRIKGLMYPLCHSVYEDTKGTSDRIPLVATVLLAVLISHQTTGPASASVGTTMRKFIKDTLAL